MPEEEIIVKSVLGIDAVEDPLVVQVWECNHCYSGVFVTGSSERSCPCRRLRVAGGSIDPYVRQGAARRRYKAKLEDIDAQRLRRFNSRVHATFHWHYATVEKIARAFPIGCSVRTTHPNGTHTRGTLTISCVAPRNYPDGAKLVAARPSGIVFEDEEGAIRANVQVSLDIEGTIKVLDQRLIYLLTADEFQSAKQRGTHRMRAWTNALEAVLQDYCDKHPQASHNITVKDVAHLNLLTTRYSSGEGMERGLRAKRRLGKLFKRAAESG